MTHGSNPLPSLLLGLTLAIAAVPMAAHAQQTRASEAASQSAKEQVVVPDVDRRDVRAPRIASKDFEVGLLFGTYAVQNFGSSAVTGLRLGYHLSEDLFAELAYGQAKVSDDTYRQILPGGIFGGQTASLKYTSLSAGYNVLPGEVFIGKGIAKATAVYLLGGVGSTNFNQQRLQTFNLGLGMRVYLHDRFSVRVDLRDHIFSLDLLGKRERTQNIELTAGLSYYF